ncbi:hypothetical protein GRI97_01360 [Altererythrobacter xixiisoli]|uniref:Uncharacterized protein n=1 Tax=Croceibacterium xixiisoli TaxID=1476466 RepID=A0A6I4TNI5_9SPHN|nr:hypothetical protein [Croceibacterium xixiisoli]MXO97635.1 hypothetical protein [Croceibacterium xixiisoli]
MIDYFTLALTHGLMLIAIWRLAFRADLDADDGTDSPRAKPWMRGRPASAGERAATARERTDDA